MLTPEQQVYQKVDETVMKANKIWPSLNMTRPIIKFDFYSSRTAGQAVINWLGERILRINPAYLNSHTEEMIKETVPHEMAHIIDYHLNGRMCGHGTSWQLIMTYLELKVQRCHHYGRIEEFAPNIKSYSYKCGCRTRQYSQRKHNNVSLRGIQYTCKVCRTAVTRA